MIIWGSKVREKTVGEGSFFCPNCQVDMAYQQRTVANYFTLYFIPIFATEQLGGYVICGGCGAQLDSSVLSMSRSQIEELVAPWTCGSCNNTNPSNYAACISCKAPRTSQGAITQAEEPRLIDSDERYRPPSMRRDIDCVEDKEAFCSGATPEDKF